MNSVADITRTLTIAKKRTDNAVFLQIAHSAIIFFFILNAVMF